MNTSGTSGYVLCIHIGASSRHAAILDEAGKLLFRNELIETPEARAKLQYQDILNDALTALTALVGQAVEAGMPKEAIIGGGAIVPGPVNPRAGYVSLLPSLPGLRNAYVARDLSEGMCEAVGRKVPFFVENDANGAALVELRFGADRSARNFAVLLLETGLGGALVLDGSLYRGHTFMAGEIGHITVAPQGPLCPCGSKGCLETVASGRALLHAVRNCCSALARRENLHCREVLDAAREGDKEIVEVLRTVGRYLGIAIANLANIFNPAKVVLSGHLARAAHFMMAPVEEEMRNRVFQGMNCDLEVSGCLEDLEVRAALSAFLSNYCR